jgi:hypothetical protein
MRTRRALSQIGGGSFVNMSQPNMEVGFPIFKWCTLVYSLGIGIE